MKDTNQNNKNEKANGRELSLLIGESPANWLILTGKTPAFQASQQTALQREVNLLAASTDEVTEALGVCQVRVHKSPPPTAMDEVMCYRECRSEVA